MKAKKRRILFIINPHSGVGKQKTAEKEIYRSLNKQRFIPEIIYTEYAGHAIEIAAKAAENKFDAVVAIGGDGSLNEVVNGVISSKTNNNIVIGLIPTGSGNGFARHLKIPLTMQKSIEVINNYNVKTIDTISLNGRPYASIAGIGFDSLIAEEMRKVKTRGFQAYFEIVIKHYFLYKPQTYKFVVDGVEMEREALFVCFANSNQFGFNTAVAPSAELDDGLMDVCVVRKIPITYLPFTGQLLYTKNFEKSKYVEIFKAKKATVFNNECGLVNLDGESINMGSVLEFEVQPKSLKIIAT